MVDHSLLFFHGKGMDGLQYFDRVVRKDIPPKRLYMSAQAFPLYSVCKVFRFRAAFFMLILFQVPNLLFMFYQVFWVLSKNFK
jgi:hypothetical protein